MLYIIVATMTSVIIDFAITSRLIAPLMQRNTHMGPRTIGPSPISEVSNAGGGKWFFVDACMVTAMVKHNGFMHC